MVVGMFCVMLMSARKNGSIEKKSDQVDQQYQLVHCKDSKVERSRRDASKCIGLWRVG